MLKKGLLTISILITLLATAQERPYDYNFFTNSRMMGNYFFSKINAEGLSSVKNERERLTVSETIFHTPGNALQLEYTNGRTGKWQATIFKPGIRGQDHFTAAAYLSFWIYNAGTETADAGLPQVQLMRRDSSLTKAAHFGNIGKGWSEVTIPSDFFGDIDPAKPEEIIAVHFSQQTNDGRKYRLIIDDICFRADLEKKKPAILPIIKGTSAYEKHVDITWEPVTDSTVKYIKIYRASDAVNYKPVGIQSAYLTRYTDFINEKAKQFQYRITYIGKGFVETPASKPMSAVLTPLSDNAILDMVQEACFRYYWEGAEKNSGLAKENIAGRHNMIATGASGFGILALIAGTERNFITRVQSVERFIRIVNFLEKAERFHGVYSHFIDGETGKAEPFFGNRDNGGDLVETSFLVQGLLAARAYFNGADPNEKIIRDKITAIWEAIEWDWYRRYADSKFLFWHWSPDKEWVINHRLIGWNETMVTYLLAITSPTHGVPASMYYTGWANQDSTGRQYRTNWGRTTDGSMYSNGKTYYGIKLDVGVSNGGPLFFTHYSYLGYDPHAITDQYTNYFTNNQNIALINHRYCVENPGRYKGYGDSCWGLTASDGPYRYAADEPVLRQDKGKIGPTGAISSFPYTPVESMKALKNYYYNYGKFIWGEYGFRDAFNLTENWCSEIYMGLNQAPMTVMIENYRSGLIWKLFMSDADVQNGLKKLAAEKP